MKLERSFFARDTNQVSAELIGKLVCCNGIHRIITETESYIGRDDPACHAAKGLTKRTQVMFGSAGFTYVFLIYGKYHCLNIVTEGINFPAATLIRGIKLVQPPYTYLDGPGKLCRWMGIDLNYNQIDVTASQQLYILDVKCKLPYKTTPRIGISKGLDKMWRYVVSDIAYLNQFGALH